MAELHLKEDSLFFLSKRFPGSLFVFPVTRVQGVIGGQLIKVPHRDTWAKYAYFLYDEGVYEIWFGRFHQDLCIGEVYVKANMSITTGFYALDSVEIMTYPPGFTVEYSEAPPRWDRKEVL